MSFYIDFILASIPILLYSILLLSVGLYIIIKKKPIISIPLFAYVLLIQAILSLINISFIKNGEIYTISNIIFLILFIACLVIFIFMLFNKQYEVFGIKKDDFNKIVIDTMNSLNMKYEQITSNAPFSGYNSIKIKTVEYEIIISLNSIAGIFSIGLIKGSKTSKDFYNILKEIKKNIMNNPVMIDTKKAIFCIVIGSIIFLIPVVLILFI
jgi:hypothetical protein